MSTYVLIPGSGGAAWYWHRVVPLLQAAGHEAVAVDLPGDDPGAGLPEYTNIVIDAIGGRENVVLVAASLGGFTAAPVAAKIPVGELVFGSPCDFASWPPVPIRAVAGADDRFFPAGFQRDQVRDRLGIEADVRPGGHLIALSQPEALTRYLLGA